jgi:sodium transport system permease protein
MTGMLRQTRTIFRTTMTDQVRDRRSVGAAFIYALAGPLLILAMFTMTAKTLDKEQPVKLAVYGAERAPELVSALARAGARVEPRSGDADALARRRPGDLGGATVALLVPSRFREDLQSERPSLVTILRDERSRRSMTDALRIEKQVRGFADGLAARRLSARGVAPQVARPLKVEGINVAATAGKALGTAKMVLFFFMLAPFFTSMTAAIDSTAGERERQSLKPLLAQPVSAGAVILGKWGVSSLFGIVGTAATIVLALFLMRFAPLEKLGITLSSGPLDQLLMLLLLIPLALAVAALQSLVAMLAKSFKEAQTYIQLLTFAPLAILTFGMVSDRPPSGISLNLPLTGHADLLTDLLAEGRIDAGQALLVTASTLVLTAAALVWAQRQLSNEKLIGQL